MKSAAIRSRKVEVVCCEIFIGVSYWRFMFQVKEKICRNGKIDSLLTIKWINTTGIQEEQEFIYLTNIPDSVDIQGNSPLICTRLKADSLR